MCSSRVYVWLVMDNFLPALSVMFNLAYTFCCVALSFIFIVEVHFIYMFHTNYSVLLLRVSFTYACRVCFLRGYAVLVSYISHWKCVGTLYVCMTARVSVIVISITLWKF